MNISARNILIYLLYAIALLLFYLGSKANTDEYIYFAGGGTLIGLTGIVRKFGFKKNKSTSVTDM